MKKIIAYSLFVLSACAMNSCTTYTKTNTVANQVYSDVMIDPVGGRLDLENVREISGKSSSWYFLFFRVSGDNKFVEVPVDGGVSGFVSKFVGRRAKRVQSSALYKATENQDVDMVLCPNYKNTKRKFLFGLVSNYKTEVRAYGAKVKNFYQYEMDGVSYGNKKGSPKLNLHRVDYTTKAARQSREAEAASYGSRVVGGGGYGYMGGSRGYGNNNSDDASSSVDTAPVTDRRVRAPYLEKYRDFSKRHHDGDN